MPTLLKTASFGGSKTGLATVGYTLLDTSGNVHQVRTTVGVHEIAGGCYGCNIAFDADWHGSVKWDTGEGVPVYACEQYNSISDLSIADVFTYAVEGLITFEQLQRLLLARAAGNADGGGTTDINFRDQADTKNRITMEVDENGNRASVTVDGS